MPEEQSRQISELFAQVRDVRFDLATTNASLAAHTAELRVLVDQNDKFFKLIYRLMAFFGAIFLLVIGALIYGAIGSDGLRAVRQVVPVGGAR